MRLVEGVRNSEYRLARAGGLRVRDDAAVLAGPDTNPVADDHTNTAGDSAGYRRWAALSTCRPYDNLG